MTSKRPNQDRELQAWAQRCLLIGVDEAGRGPLAGPVVAAAVAFPIGAAPIGGVRDSKTVARSRHSQLADSIRINALGVGVGASSVREIDRLNIRRATALAMKRAISSLTRSLGQQPYRVIIDGLPMPELGIEHEALVDGDADCHTIAAAGLIAKTVRDRLMSRLAERYRAYGWSTNAGYGTKNHLAALRRLGPTRHHRQSFAPLNQSGLWSVTV